MPSSPAVGGPGTAAGVRDGRMRVLALLADKRSEVLPGVPSTTELGYPKLASETWMGLLAPGAHRSRSRRGSIPPSMPHWPTRNCAHA